MNSRDIMGESLVDANF